jgi:hypothetical protein
VIVLINVFTVDPTNQQRFVGILTKAIDVSVRQATGFISAIFTGVSTAQGSRCMRNGRALLNTKQRERILPRVLSFEEALSIAKFEPGMYEVVRTFAPVDT